MIFRAISTAANTAAVGKIAAISIAPMIGSIATVVHAIAKVPKKLK
jgi:hypothetical protein